MRFQPRALAALPFLLLVACGGSKAGPAEEEPGTPVHVQPVSRQSIARVVAYPADIQPWTEVQLYTTVADRVLSLPFDDGDEVREGQRVALIRRSGLDKGIEQIAAQIEAIDVQIRTQAQDVERNRKLLEGGVITQQVFDQAQAAYEANQAQRRALQASLEQLSINAGEASVTAPISGVLADLAVDIGDRTSPQAPLASILVVDPLRVELHLPETDARQVKPGDPVQVEVPAWPGRTFEGEVHQVRPYLEDATRTNTVEVRLPNPADEAGARPLKPGMFGRAHLTLDQREDAVVAPEPALVLDPVLLSEAEPGQDLRKAFVVDAQGVARERRVELGIRSGTLYEVRTGLEPGERLVVRGQHGLKEGEAVRVVEDAS